MSELCSTFSTKIIRKERIQVLTNIEKALKAPQSLPHTFYCSSPRCQREFGSPLSELSLSVIIEIIIKLNSYLDWNRWMELFSTRLKKIKIVKKILYFWLFQGGERRVGGLLVPLVQCRLSAGTRSWQDTKVQPSPQWVTRGYQGYMGIIFASASSLEIHKHTFFTLSKVSPAWLLVVWHFCF